MTDVPAYGLWLLVLINSAFFIFFAASFSGFSINRDWRSLGPYVAFIVAFFTEMYGFPFTIYLLSGWLSERYPEIDLLSHDAGHLWTTLLGLKGNPHWSMLHILSYGFIAAGFTLLSTAWHRLYRAQKSGTVATKGPYAYVRHPQYGAFVIIMFGFLLQWPTLPTLIMFPILVFVYARLACREERDMAARFGAAYENYRRTVPAFIPWLGRVRTERLGMRK